MHIHIPPGYPAESLVLFVMSTWHVLVALLISRAGVLRRELPLPGNAPSAATVIEPAQAPLSGDQSPALP